MQGTDDTIFDEINKVTALKEFTFWWEQNRQTSTQEMSQIAIITVHRIK
jgi:hypothetical protein